MNLVLARIPAYRGIYGSSKDLLGRQQRLLAPDAAASLAVVEADSGGLVYSDIFRTAQASLDAIQRKAGVQPPAYSGHNFGLCVDLAVDLVLSIRKWTYTYLLDFMAAHGWHCHRRDRKTGNESWHLNYFGDQATKYLGLVDASMPKTWSRAIEAEIVERHGADFKLGPVDVQAALAKLSLYGEPLDGDLAGAPSMTAVKAFQGTWKLNVDGVPGTVTQRTLALVTASLVVQE